MSSMNDRYDRPEFLRDGSRTGESLLLGLMTARITFLPSRLRQRLRERLHGTEDLLRLGCSGAEGLLGRSLPRAKWKPEQWLRGAEADARWLEQSRHTQAVFLGDSCYPELLAVLSAPPFRLFVRGRLEALHRRTAAVVGTRKPSQRGRQGAYRLAYGLAERGWTVVSGLARGVDGAAHAGALDAGGLTAAVLGSGPDWVYPPEHRRLAGRILEKGGALLSEYPPGDKPAAWHFPARNRIISGLSEAVVVAEAPGKSGAMITGELALNQGRDVAVLQDGLMSGAAQGLRSLEKDGAVVVRDAAQVTALAGGLPWQIEDEQEEPDGPRPGDSGPDGRAGGSPDAVGRAVSEALMAEMAGRRYRFAGGWFERS